MHKVAFADILHNADSYISNFSALSFCFLYETFAAQRFAITLPARQLEYYQWRRGRLFCVTSV